MTNGAKSAVGVHFNNLFGIASVAFDPKYLSSLQKT